MSDNVRIALIAGGVAAVLLAVIWRLVVVNGRRRRLRKGLRATDPQDRARAGILLVDEGLHRSARVLLAHVAAEPDPRVNHAIALAVARRQWEPVDARGARQLREWASKELEQRGERVAPFGRAVTRLSDMGGPRPPDYQAPPGASTPAASAPADTEAAGTEPAEAGAADPSAEVHWRADQPGTG
jgi:hypothetical protein